MRLLKTLPSKRALIVLIFFSFNIVNAQESSIMVNIGSSVPSSGIFNRDYNSSSNFGVGLEIKINSKFNASVEFSKSSFKTSSRSIVSIPSTLNTYIISLNGKYIFYNKNKLSLNLGIGMGYDYYKLEYSNFNSISIRSAADGSYSIIPSLNLEYKIIPRLYVFSNLSYNQVLKNQMKLYEINTGTGEVKELDTYNLSYYQIKFGLKCTFKL